MKKLVFLFFLPFFAFTGLAQNANVQYNPNTGNITSTYGALPGTPGAKVPSTGVIEFLAGSTLAIDAGATVTGISGSGTVTVSGTPASGQVALFSGSTVIGGQTLSTWTPTFKGLTSNRTDGTYGLTLADATNSYGFAVAGANGTFDDITHTLSLIKWNGGGQIFFPQLSSNGFLKSNTGGGQVTTSAQVNAATEITGTLPSANLPVGSSSVLGGVKVDGASILASSGVISANPAAIFSSITSPASTDLSLSAASSQNIRVNTDTVFNNQHYAIFSTGTGIGTGSLYINFTTGVGAFFQTFGAASPMIFDALDHQFQTSGSATALVINTSAAIQMGHYGAGTATFDSSGNITSTSDGRLKTVDGKFARGLSEVLGLRPVLFHWKQESGMNVKDVNAGFIAQDVQRVIPEAVGVMNDGTGHLTLSDRAIIAALVNATQELHYQLRVLQAFVGLMVVFFFVTKLIRK